MMFNEYHISRLSLAWLMIAQTFILLPQLLRFPSLLILPYLLCFSWRFRAFQGKAPLPNRWVKTLLVIICLSALSFSSLSWTSSEMMICLMLLAYLLKLLEMKQHRDVLIMAYLSFFAIVTQLLLSQSIFSGMYLFIALLLATTFLIAAYAYKEQKDFFSPLKTAMKMLMVSLPIMLMAFVVFPRLDPFWSVPLPQGKGITGMSALMSPGKISQLAQSDELAFRASFNNDIPALPELYWRAMTLSNFDGETWQVRLESKQDKAWNYSVPNGQTSNAVSYDITLEPTQQRWLFSLPNTVQSNADVFYLSDNTIKATSPIRSRFRYNITSLMNGQRVNDLDRSSVQLKPYLQLPRAYNPKTLAFAQQQWKSADSPQQYVQNILTYFSEKPFYYTLSPKALGRDYIDEFLFSTREGFCEHYASSFVVLMRAAGIPARVVAGYQGGDVNPFENHVTVRQLDAHAWAEVWFVGQGWQRIDPTAAVAPNRILLGSLESLRNDDSFLADSPLSARHYQSFSWLLNASYRYDQLNALWHQKVLNYTGETQENVLKSILGEVSIRNMAVFVGTSFLLFSSLSGLYFLLLMRPQSISVHQKSYVQLINKLRKRGLTKYRHEGPADFQRRAVEHWPQQKAELEQVFQTYIQLQYQHQQLNPALLKLFQRQVKSLSLKKKI